MESQPAAEPELAAEPEPAAENPPEQSAESAVHMTGEAPAPMEEETDPKPNDDQLVETELAATDVKEVADADSGANDATDEAAAPVNSSPDDTEVIAVTVAEIVEKLQETKAGPEVINDVLDKALSEAGPTEPGPNFDKPADGRADVVEEATTEPRADAHEPAEVPKDTLDEKEAAEENSEAPPELVAEEIKEDDAELTKDEAKRDPPLEEVPAGDAAGDAGKEEPLAEEATTEEAPKDGGAEDAAPKEADEEAPEPEILTTEGEVVAQKEMPLDAPAAAPKTDTAPEPAEGDAGANVTEMAAVVDEPAPESAPTSPEVDHGPSSSRLRRRRHTEKERQWDREDQTPILNGHKTRLERNKAKAGLFVNNFAVAIDKAKEERDYRHHTPEYRDKIRRRRESRAEHDEAARAKQRAEKEALKDREERTREAAAAAEAKRVEKARDRAALTSRSPPSPRLQWSRTVRRPSFAESSGGETAGPVRPGLLSRMATVPSDTGGTLLMFPISRAAGPVPIPRSAPVSPPLSGTGDKELRKHHSSKHRDEEKPHNAHGGDGKKDDKRRRQHHRHSSSRESSYKSPSSPDDMIPAIKFKNAVVQGLKKTLMVH